MHPPSQPDQPTRDQFLQWRSPVRGTHNPQRMNNPLWEWCVRNPESAYAVNKTFHGPDACAAGPCWCFSRLGQARVDLPDGREVYLAGEHEDFYDPDFYIYNDVVIVDGDEVTLLGYPETVFPPTDFHSATLAGSTILLVGNLGYPHDRDPLRTQVLRLDTSTWQIEPVETTGQGPGWIHAHTASFSPDENALRIAGGKTLVGERIVENFDDYRLCLQTLAWTKLTDRRWEQWILEREDGQPNKLWEIRTASWDREFGMSLGDRFQEMFAELPAGLAADLTPKATDEQIALLKTLYQFPVSDDVATEDEEEYGRYRLNVEGTTVRFDEAMYGITVTVEGHLPADTVEAILSHLQTKLSSLERTAYKRTRIGG